MTKKPEDCFSCKLISIAATLGIGTYFFYQGRLQKSQAKYAYYALGTVSASLGIREILGKQVPINEPSWAYLPTFPNLVSVFGLAVTFCTATIHSFALVCKLRKSRMYSSRSNLAAWFRTVSPKSKPKSAL